MRNEVITKHVWVNAVAVSDLGDDITVRGNADTVDGEACGSALSSAVKKRGLCTPPSLANEWACAVFGSLDGRERWSLTPTLSRRMFRYRVRMAGSPTDLRRRRSRRLRRSSSRLRGSTAVTAGAWLLCLLEVVWWRDRSVLMVWSPPQMAWPWPGGDLWSLLLVVLSVLLLVQIASLVLLELVLVRLGRRISGHRETRRLNP